MCVCIYLMLFHELALGQTLAQVHEADIATVKGLDRFAMGELLVLPQTFG